MNVLANVRLGLSDGASQFENRELHGLLLISLKFGEIYECIVRTSNHGVPSRRRAPGLKFLAHLDVRQPGEEQATWPHKSRDTPRSGIKLGDSGADVRQ